MQIIDRLSKTKNGISELIENDFFVYFLTGELLYRTCTLVSTRHLSASVIVRIAAIFPSHFCMETFQNVCYDGLNRKIDGVIETMLLESVLSHLTWLSMENKGLNCDCTIMTYLIDEVRKEAFEDVNHV